MAGLFFWQGNAGLKVLTSVAPGKRQFSDTGVIELTAPLRGHLVILLLGRVIDWQAQPGIGSKRLGDPRVLGSMLC